MIYVNTEYFYRKKMGEGGHIVFSDGHWWWWWAVLLVFISFLGGGTNFILSILLFDHHPCQSIYGCIVLLLLVIFIL